MRRTRSVLGAGIALALGAGAVGIGPAGAASGPTSAAVGGIDFQPNRYVRSTQRYSADRVTVAPGGTVRFTNQDQAGEPHTWTVVDYGELPRAPGEVFGQNCPTCEEAGEAHFATDPPTTTVDVGASGFGERGDSVLLFPGQSEEVTVTAKAPSNLYYLCIFHPWMQARINVR